MLTIPLPNLNQSGIDPLYSGNIKRLATATGVKIIDPYHFLASNYVGQRMYLFEFNFQTKEYTLLDQIDTTYHNEKVASELIDYDGKDLVAISNFTAGSHNNSASYLTTFGEQVHIRFAQLITFAGMVFNRTTFIYMNYVSLRSVHFVHIRFAQLIAFAKMVFNLQELRLTAFGSL